MDLNSLVQDEDLCSAAPAAAPMVVKRDAEAVMDDMDTPALSARQKNMLKRKAKQQARGGKRARDAGGGGDGSSAGAAGAAAGGGDGDATSAAAAEDDDAEAAEVEAGQWPFQRLCDHLTHDVFDSKWEVRRNWFHRRCVHMQSACVYHVSTSFMGDGFQFPKLNGSSFSLAPDCVLQLSR
jgi:hypothetical protein